MPIRPPNKSNLICKDCNYLLSSVEFFYLKAKIKFSLAETVICPKCKSKNVQYVVF